MDIEDKVDVKLNQNLWGLIVAYAALGAAEHWGLRFLFWPALIAAWGLSVLVLIAFVFYTIHYCARKCIRTTRLVRQNTGSVRAGQR